jgi:endonuclease/exonuclease/phosphatase family metal-dependent hydrolase
VAPSFARTAEPPARASGAARASETRGAGAGSELCVVTYNMNYGVAGDGGTVDVLDGVDADVIVLQETNAEWEGAIRRRLGGRYADIRFHDPVRLAPGGSGALSKYPIESEKLVPSAVNWFPATVLVVRTEAGPVQIVNVHLRPMVTDSGSWIKGYFTTGDYRVREIAAIRRELDETLPTIWAGDFNEAEDAGGISGLGASGFVSALPEKDPHAVTWHWDYDGIPLALRLDHVLYDRDDFALEDAEVLGGGRSDHFAVKVTLRRAVTD